MLEIRNIAAEGLDRAIITMRRDRGGREASDSEWKFDAEEGGCFFDIGEDDKAECIRLIESGDRDFLKFVGLWAHIEAPAQWWAVYGGYFLAQSDVIRKGDTLTRSIFTTYGHLRNLIEVVSEGSDNWKMQAELCKMLEELPENWMILSGMEA